MKTLTSPPRLHLRSGMQIFVKHWHAFGLKHPKGVTLHLVLRLRGGMQIFMIDKTINFEVESSDTIN